MSCGTRIWSRIPFGSCIGCAEKGYSHVAQNPLPMDLVPPDLKAGAEEFIDDFRDQWLTLVETSAQSGKRPMMIFLPTQGDPLLVGRDTKPHRMSRR